jgi:hypothetical protein
MAGPQPGEHPATGALPTQPQPTTPDPTSSRATPEPQVTSAPTAADPATAAAGSTGSTATTTAVQPAATTPGPTAQDDEPTGTIVPRWTGSAAVPPPMPRRRWWHRLTPAAGTPAPTAASGAATEPVATFRPARSGPTAPLDPTRAEITRRQPEPLNRTAVMPDPAEVDAALAFRPEPAEPYRERSYLDWENTPPVDPWADHDTVWQAAPGAPVTPPSHVGPPVGPFPPALFGRGALPPTLTGPAGTMAGRAGATPHPPSTTPPATTVPAGGWGGQDAADTPTRDDDSPGAAGQSASGHGAGGPSWRRRLFTRPSSRTARPAAGTATAGPAQAAAARAPQAPAAPGTPPPSSWAPRAQPLVQGGSALRLPPSAPVPPPGWAPPGQAAQGGAPPSSTAPTRPPAPAKGKPAKAPKESRADRKRRLRTGDLPPPWSPPTPAPPPPRRRKRRRLRLWILLLIAMLVAAYWYGGASLLGLPYAGQYPVSPSLPEQVADLHLRDDASSNRTAERLAQSLHDAGVADDEVFAGVYGDDNGKRVAVFGTTGFRLTPHNDVEDEIQRLAAEYDLTDIASFDLGEIGVHERCGVGRSDGTSVVVCSWADHGSLGSAMLTRRSLSDSADVVGLLREAVLNRP